MTVPGPEVFHVDGLSCRSIGQGLFERAFETGDRAMVRKRRGLGLRTVDGDLYQNWKLAYAAWAPKSWERERRVGVWRGRQSRGSSNDRHRQRNEGEYRSNTKLAHNPLPGQPGALFTPASG